MRRFVFTMTLGFSLCGASAFAATMTGYVSDSKCLKAHMDGSEKSVKCVQACVKGGQAPVFISGDKVYKISDVDKVKEHLGHKVTVTGDVKEDTIEIETIEMAGS